MPYAIRNKKKQKWLWGTDFRYPSPQQRLSDDTPYLYPTQSLAELALKVRRCNADYEIVKVEVEPVRHARLINAHPYGECSCCGELIDSRDRFRYCPKCGARLYGEGEDE